MPAPKVGPRVSREGERTATVRAAQAIAIAASNLADHTARDECGARRQSPRNAAATPCRWHAHIGKKLAHHLIAREPTAEIEALARRVPRLARCRPAPGHPLPSRACRGHARNRHRRASPTSGFTGRLVVLGDPDLASATRASNGPTAASFAITPRSKPRSTTASRNSSPPAAQSRPHPEDRSQ